MTIESGTYIDSFDPSKPGPTDPKSEGDDHLRLIKARIKASFPLVAGPVPIAHNQFASKDYVNQTAFSAALPAQPGGTTPYNLVTVNGSASWQQATNIYDNNTRLAQVQAIALCF